MSAHKPAARVTDKTTHGGVITSGSPNVNIGGLKAARLLDQHACPKTTGSVPHIAGPVIECSQTVLINNRGAARVDDALMCFIPAPPPPDDPTAGTTHGASTKKELGAKERTSEEWKEGWKDKKPDPSLKVSVVDKTWAKDSGAVGEFLGGHGKAISGEYSVSSKVEAEFKSLKDFKAEVTPIDAKASGALVEMEAKGEGSLGEGSVSGKAGTASAHAKVGAVVDPNKNTYTAGAEVGAEAAVLEGKVAGKSAPLRIPFTDWGISFGAEVSGALLTAAAKADATAGYSPEDGFHAKLGAKLGAAIAGLGAKLEISIKPMPPPPPPPVADLISTGDPTVLIGD